MSPVAVKEFMAATPQSHGNIAATGAMGKRNGPKPAASAIDEGFSDIRWPDCLKPASNTLLSA
jgi:hypothetical protein